VKGPLQANVAMTTIVVAGLVFAAMAANSGRPGSAEVVSYEPNVPALDGELDRSDGFGTAIGVIGDLDGNGFPELVVGAPGDDDLKNSGAVWTVFLGPTGSLQSASKISPTRGGFDPGSEISMFSIGRALAGTGDLDADGVADFAIGDPEGLGGMMSRGQLWLIRAQPDGTVKLETRIHGTVPPPDPEPGCAATTTTTTLTTMTAPVPSTTSTTTTLGTDGPTLPYYYQDGFGNALGATGGPAGSTVRLAVGAPLSDHDGCNAGAVWLIDLDSAGDIAGSEEVFVDGTQLGAEFGSSVAWLGDLDGDGTVELAVSEPWRGDYLDPPGDSTIWVLSVDASRSIVATKRIDSEVVNLGPHRRFGSALAAIGDVDGDGIGDLAVSDFWDPADLYPNDGVVWILFLQSDGSVKDSRRIAVSDGPIASVIGVPRSFRNFGASLAGPGDLDGDSVPELVIGVPGYGASATNSPGAILIVYLDAAGGVKNVRRITDESSNATTTTDWWYTSTTNFEEEFYCGFDIGLYDPVAITYLRLRPGMWGSCRTPIPGVTIREVYEHGPVVMENFPPDFRGPATLLICGANYHHSECAPTLEETDLYLHVDEARGADGEPIAVPAVCATYIDCDWWPCGEDGPLVADMCGDPNRDGHVTATDALMALMTAVSDGDCPATECDADRDGGIDATDALRILQAGLEYPVRTDLLVCPAPCGSGVP
jgi:hypothetical protein